MRRRRRRKRRKKRRRRIRKRVFSSIKYNPYSIMEA